MSLREPPSGTGRAPKWPHFCAARAPYSRASDQPSIAQSLPRKRWRSRLLLCVGALVASGVFAPAATLTWTGGAGDGNVLTAGNWSPSQVPAASDLLIFDGTNSLLPQLSSGYTVGSLTFASGAGAFTLGGAGIYTIKTAAGVTNNSANTETISNAITLGLAQTWTAASGNLAFGGNINNAGLGLTIGGSFNTSISGIISGAGSLTKSGTGTLTLSGANSNTGTTTVNAGVLNIQSASGLGTTAAGTTVNTGAALQIQGGGIAVGAEALTLNGSGIASDGALRNISGANSWSGAIALGSASVIGSDSGNLTLSGVISGAFNLTKVGAGTLTLTNTGNTFTGTVTVQNGTLSYATTVLGPGTNGVVLGGTGTTGTLQYTGPSGTTARTYTLATGGTGVFDISSSASVFTISSVVAGTGNLRKAGSGTLLLSGAASYTGATRIDAGSLRLGIANAVPNTAVTVSGGSAGTTATLDLNGFNESLLSLNLGGATTTSGASVTGAGTLTLGGDITYDATNNPLGATISANTLALGATRAFNVGDSTSTTADLTVSSIISGTGFGLTKTGAGTLTLSGANTYSGGTTLNGGTTVINSTSSLGTNTGATINAATLEVSTGFTSTRVFTLGDTASAIKVDSGQTYSLSNGIIGSGALNASGPGTLQLNGANTYTGATNVTSGTITLGASASLASTALTVSNGATFNGNATATLPTTLAVTANGAINFNSSARTIASLDGASSGVVTLNSTNLTASSGSYGGVIQNGASSGSITKAGSGTWTLTGANTFTGTTTVNAGTMILAAPGTSSALGATSAITVNSGGTLLLGANNQIKDTAPVTLVGGTLAKGNFSEGSTSTPGMGALTLTAAGSHLDFGSGTVGTLNFASFTPGSFVLTIDNWTGTFNTAGSATTDRLIFDTTQTANLNSFSFTGFGTGASQFALGDGFYEITPLTAVPEPSTYATAALAAMGLAAHLFRRRRKAARE